MQGVLGGGYVLEWRAGTDVSGLFVAVESISEGDGTCVLYWRLLFCFIYTS